MGRSWDFRGQKLMMVMIRWTYILASAISKYPNIPVYAYALLRSLSCSFTIGIYIRFENWFIVHLNNKFINKYDGLASLAP